MKLWNRLAGFSLAIVVISAAGLASAQEPTAGVVRISDNVAVGEQMKLLSHRMMKEHPEAVCETETGACESTACGPTGECDSHEVCLHRYTLRNIYWHIKYSHPWCCLGCDKDCDDECRKCPPEKCPHCRNGNCPYHGHSKHGHSKSGHGYKATRGVAPFGCYTMAYPVNPDYCDGRDGGLYAAQGYGINVTVPLAPNVGAAYNYGWGVPSSRLTPISNPLPVPPMSSPMHGPSPIVIRNR